MEQRIRVTRPDGQIRDVIREVDIQSENELRICAEIFSWIIRRDNIQKFIFINTNPTIQSKMMDILNVEQVQ